MKKNLILIAALLFFVLPAWSQVRFSEQMVLDTGEVESIAYDGVNIWVNHDGQTLSALDPVSGQELFQIGLAQSGQSLAFDGRRLLIAQNSGKQILAVDRATGDADTFIDLKSIQGDRDLYLEPLRSGKIMGLACGDGYIWVASSAGYSSSIYQIDPSRGVVVAQRYSPGPTPVSMVYSNGDLWVLDGANAELRCLKDCKQLVYGLSIFAGEKPVALLDFQDKVFVVGNERAPLVGIGKKALSAVVPEKIDLETATLYQSQQRQAKEGGRKVAVLISGDTAASGFNEFWTDVVIMYRILKARGYAEIYTLYADGKNYKCGWDKYEMKMADFPATKSDVVKIFNALANGDSTLGITQLAANDTLFIYTFDHGDRQGRLCLWRGDRYTPSEMVNAMRQINCKQKIFYMQQCFSGAFKEQFKSSGVKNVTIITACSNRQYAYRADTENENHNGKKFYHGEFNYHFMSALAKITPKGEKVDADVNDDGMVSVHETFEYYKKMNSKPQTPQQYYNPEKKGEKITP